MSKPNGTIQAATVGNDLMVKIHGVIGWDVLASDLAAILDTATPDKCGRVVFEIYSPGGSVWEGNYICSRIRELQVPTEARVYIAASMATLLAVSCQRVVMAQNGRWLIHNPWTAAVGDAAALEKQARELRATEDEAAAIYAAKTGAEPDEMLALMAEETWITADVAAELGFVDELTARYDHAAYADLRATCLAYEGLGQAAAAALEDVPEQPAEPEEVADVPAVEPVSTTEGTSAADATEPLTVADDDFAAYVERVDELVAENTDLARAAEECRQQALTAQAAAEKATSDAVGLSAQVNALTTARDDLTGQVNAITSERTALQSEVARKEIVIADLQRRLRAFSGGLAGTDEDLDRIEGPGAGDWWAKVAELRAAGLTPEAAQLAATEQYPQLHARMLRDANRNQKNSKGR